MHRGLTAMPAMQPEGADLSPSVTPFFNRLSFIIVSCIKSSVDQKTIQELVLVNTLEQSNELKSCSSSSEISSVKYYCLDRHI